MLVLRCVFFFVLCVSDRGSAQEHVDLKSSKCSRNGDYIINTQGTADIGNTNGRCSCYQFYYGDNCECNDRSCNYFNNSLCGGPAHGTCVCGTCSCNPRYTGESCGCTTNTDTCISSDGSICNNHGYCECGRCSCYEGSRYQGPLCEDCKDCNNWCTKLKACVQCKIFRTGELSAEGCDNCSDRYDIYPVDTVPEYSLCVFKDLDDNCIFYFGYLISDQHNEISVPVQSTKDCPTPLTRRMKIFLGLINEE
ncbi:ITGB1 [Mytilus coruscus]|uniref:ITGB1 n=1 Tax=Mytilus coruscus TaxID=42192 RepID=A0A6J8B4L2_MYTCO|nr:ITGB1 [Mytilus coruscus]